MPMKTINYTDNVGGGYPERERKTSVKMRTRTSEMDHSVHGGPGSDPLKKSFGQVGRLRPSDNHIYKGRKTPSARGALYNPMGEFGKLDKTANKLPSKATGMGSYRSPAGHNAVGSNMNRRGYNPIGNAPNRSGPNAIGNTQNKSGSNALRGPSNRTGENALASKFKPFYGGKNANL